MVGLAFLAIACSAHAGMDDGFAAVGRGDFTAAMAEFRPLAEQGNILAQYQVGWAYYNGLGVPQDYIEAYAWYSVAAANGSVNAAGRRDALARELTPSQLEKGQGLARIYFSQYRRGLGL
jgi:TPR repeat protein